MHFIMLDVLPRAVRASASLTFLLDSSISAAAEGTNYFYTCKLLMVR